MTNTNPPKIGVEELSQDEWRKKWLDYLAGAECVDEAGMSWLIAEFVKQNLEEMSTTIYQRGSKEGAMKQNEMFVRHIDEIMKVTTNPHELVDWLVFYRNTINPNNYEHTSTTKQ